MSGEEVGPAIGIDLGTTHSCVAVCKHGGVKIIPNDQGYSTTPSYVAFTDYELLVGNEAKNQIAMNPSNTVFGKVSNMTFFSNLFIRKRRQSF
ncbi:putative mediator of rna polymerase ii transcription subunit 37c [Quercus suber]|uniref:Mediator of rna polymerase ii transcription subunit 37c n=1 Tax=Quercus suber TaxID=58331 RepID=A0AAW0KIU0_QUESU